MLFIQTRVIPSQLLSRLYQPAIIAPMHTKRVHRKGRISNFILLNASKTTVVLKIAHLLKARNIGMFMFRIL
jgi:hypothetical protein